MNRIEPKSYIKKSKQKCFGFFLSQPVTGLAKQKCFGFFSFLAGDWFGKHSVWISKRISGSAPPPAELHRLILFKE